jgi:hypothetical protein
MNIPHPGRFTGSSGSAPCSTCRIKVNKLLYKFNDDLQWREDRPMIFELEERDCAARQAAAFHRGAAAC